MVEPILKIIKAINSEQGPWQLSFAVSLALVLGFTPLWSVHNVIVLLCAFIFRVHLATFFVFWALFSGIAYMIDPWFHQIGLSLLTQPGMQATWTAMYQNDFWLVTHFNHTITLGSLLVALIAFFPVAVFFRFSVVKYRASMMPWFNKLKVVQVLKASRVYELYQRLGN